MSFTDKLKKIAKRVYYEFGKRTAETPMYMLLRGKGQNEYPITICPYTNECDLGENLLEEDIIFVGSIRCTQCVSFLSRNQDKKWVECLRAERGENEIHR